MRQNRNEIKTSRAELVLNIAYQNSSINNEFIKKCKMEYKLKKVLIMVPLVALAACGTPRENCIYQANEQLRDLDNRIEVAQGNVDRGFAISRGTDRRTVEATCRDLLPDGTVREYDCDRTETISTSRPVQIDIADERRKLAGLKRQRGQLVEATQKAEQQCIAIHPE